LNSLKQGSAAEQTEKNDENGDKSSTHVDTMEVDAPRESSDNQDEPVEEANVPEGMQLSRILLYFCTFRRRTF
jgi:hypothetical protein